jgi:hypothetical protein
MDMGCGFSFVHLGRLMEGMLMDWEREGWVALGLEDRRLERREKEGVMVRVSICRDCRCRRDEGWVKYMGRGEWEAGWEVCKEEKITSIDIWYRGEEAW